VEETNRIVAQIQAQLKIKVVPPPASEKKRAGSGG
jgi:hypothetical protein